MLLLLESRKAVFRCGMFALHKITPHVLGDDSFLILLLVDACERRQTTSRFQRPQSIIF